MAASELLSGPAPPSCRSKPIDFVKAGLSEYAHSFALAIENLVTPEECSALLAAAESTTDRKWEQAMVNVGGGEQQLIIDTRNCGRIIWDDARLAGRLQTRIMPHLPKEIVTLINQPAITGKGPVKRGEVWQLTRLNERLRFLKYTHGMYFREHCDGSYVTPDGREVSFLTVHLYLNGDPVESRNVGLGQDTCDSDELRDSQPLAGGATRFFSWREDKFFDLIPSMGSCIVFQHRDLLHSGEDVLQGTKYTMRTDIMYEKMKM